jgi:hypothetical protein
MLKRIRCLKKNATPEKEMCVKKRGWGKPSFEIRF